MKGSKDEPSKTAQTMATLNYFKIQSATFAAQCSELENKIALMDGSKSTWSEAVLALRNCRLAYKRIAFFMNYFLTSPAIIYNAPPNPEVEVPFMEYREPSGLQLMETFLFEKEPILYQKELAEQARLISFSAGDLNSLLYNLEIDDAQIMESLRLSLIGLYTLELSGYDAPELKSGIAEAKYSLQAIKEVLKPYFIAHNEIDQVSLLAYLDQGLLYLDKNEDFDRFDRLYFTKHIAIPLQDKLDSFIKAAKLELTGIKTLAYGKTLFEKTAIKLGQQRSHNNYIVLLGKKLFDERALSGNLSRSCSSCHHQNNYFTDGLVKSPAIRKKDTLPRNTPTLLYAAFQHSQFWDGRAKDFEQLIIEVLQNPKEMDADLKVIEERLNNSKMYKSAFDKAFPDRKGGKATMDMVVHSIAAYLQTLSPFNSAFDRYMAGQQQAMSKDQIRGYNLFMGKAQCGTCHFAPIFNGLVPPLYNLTDLEVLGVTRTDQFEKPVLDTDSGRFKTYPIMYYNGAFKTPTLRNIAKTAPYMHNGAFKTLNAVVEFYNKGGGAGMGLDVPVQTLSAKPLNLNQKEIDDIVAFLNSLTDNIK